MSSLFANNGQTLVGGESSTNQAYPYLKGALSGNISNGSAAGGTLADLLGLNGAAGSSAGFNNFRNSTGYQFGLNQGLQSITGNAATQGLLNSGGTLKAMDTYGQNYANTQYGNYTGMLQQLLGAGNQSAGILGSAGNTSQKQPGIMSGLGQLLGKGTG
jgi:hypothetical protein